jgi:hypothetical protein
VDKEQDNTNATEEYDGSSWTAGGNLNTTRGLAGCGIQTAGFSFWWDTQQLTGAKQNYMMEQLDICTSNFNS